MNLPSIDIIICAYNNQDIISQCLDHIHALNYNNKKCIVVDDKSTDNTVGIIRQKYPWARVIEKKEHSGPSISRNLAIKSSSGKYILFLDSDVMVKPYFLDNLIESMKKNSDKPEICGGKLLLMDKTIDSAGGEILKIGVGFDRGHGAKEIEYSDGSEVMYIPSAAMLVKRYVFDKIGLFDDTYFYGHEDTDFCWRARIAGFKIYYEPNAIAYHYKNRTIRNMGKDVYYYGVRNRIRSLIKNHEFATLIIYLPLYTSYLLFSIIFGSYRLQKIKAVWWNLTNIRETLKERNKIQALRKVKDKHLPFSSMFGQR